MKTFLNITAPRTESSPVFLMFKFTPPHQLSEHKLVISHYNLKALSCKGYRTYTFLYTVAFPASGFHCTGNVSPYQMKVSSYKMNVFPYKMKVSPYRMNVSPYRMNVSPYRMKVSPYRMKVSPYRMKISPYKGNYCNKWYCYQLN